MAVLRLKVDVDSDVYPELYARLRSIDKPQAREERLRQLAASGLVWEAVRMHGPAATAMPPPVPSAPKPHAAAPGRPAVPVLMDVVDESGVSAPVPLDEPDLPPPLQTDVQQASPRSTRMRRMVDRGLFKNE